MKDAALRRILPLNPDSLIYATRKATKLDDFGSPPLLEPLKTLLESCEHEAALSLFGRLALRGEIKRLLTTRLRIQADRERLPGITKEKIERPIFITGLPRTGSTLLQALMTQDPNHRAPLIWETMYPSPPPFENGKNGNNSRIKITRRQLRWFEILTPNFNAIHELGAELPHECIAITANTFISLRFLVTYWLPTYANYLSMADNEPIYHFHKRFLQHLQYNAEPRRWVLKAPAHLSSLDALLAVYPDALILHTHRDPVDSIPSLASLRTELRSCFSNKVIPAAYGPEVALYWSMALEQAETVKRHCALSQFYDVQYETLVQNPICTIKKIYSHFGMELTREAESQMRDYLRNNPRGKHGSHQYRSEDYGLTPGTVEWLFKKYRVRMGWA